MTKNELRKWFLKKRQALGEAEYLDLSRRLCENFFSRVDLSFIKVLHTFLPIEEKREPDTWLMVDRIRREFPNIRISLPKMNPTIQHLDNFYFVGLDQLSKNPWGIWEPKQGILTPVEEIDMVLVPLLAVDKTGHRVGYGKGYYDSLLSQCRPGCNKIGITFFEPVETIDDITSRDIQLNGCITPSHYHSF